VQLLASPTPQGISDLEHIVASINAIHGTDSFDDDFSLMKVCF